MKYLLLFALLTSCASPKSEPEPTYPVCPEVQETGIGIVIGDSIAEGVPKYGRLRGNCSNKPGQPAFEIERYTNLRVLNYGRGGHTCDQVLERWEQNVEKYKPAFVYVNCGQNDMVHESNPAHKVIQAYQTMMQKADQGGYKIYFQNMAHVIGQPQHDTNIDTVNQFLTLIQAQGRNDRIVVDYKSWIEPRPQYLPDGLHPTERAYIEFFEHLNDLGMF